MAEVKRCVKLLHSGEGITPEDAQAAMRQMMDGSAPDSVVGALLTAIETKEAATPEIIKAFADVMLDFSISCEARGPEGSSPVIDIVGTGGDGMDAFNVSTAAGLVAAACGAVVAKHGNRSSSGNIGSADFLEALGANINLDAQQTQQAIEASGFGFLFAQKFHPAMKNVAAVRKELGIRTIFNLLGPLTNPAEPRRQVIGVSKPELGPVFADILRLRGAQHALVVHSTDGLDEISIAAPTLVWEVRDGEISERTISPEDFGLDTHPLAHVCGGTLEDRMSAFHLALSNRPSAIRDFVLINAAAALYVAGVCDNFKAATIIAQSSLEDGRAASTVRSYVEATQAATLSSEAPSPFGAVEGFQPSNDSVSPDAAIKVMSYQTKGHIHVTRCEEPLANPEHEISLLAKQLDTSLGQVILSDYEHPGRYHYWMRGFVNPPLMLVCRQRSFTITALNERGEVLFPVIVRFLKNCDYLASFEADALLIRGTVKTPEGRFSEEDRSRQSSIFSVVRSLIDLFHSDEDSVLGLYGAFGYDLTFQFEETKLRKQRPDTQRDLVLYIADEFIDWDSKTGVARRLSYDFAIDGETTVGRVRDGPQTVFVPQQDATAHCDHKPGQYADKVRLAKESFKRGDLFEAVLSQTFHDACPCQPSELFRRLRRRNPAPFTFLINLGSSEYLVGASPEMYVRVEGRRVETCPISGPIPRGRDAVEDAAQILKLLSDPKEESELTMCTDVDRNDKSRICEAGSVKVLARRQIEKYSRLIHTVDHVEGYLRPEFDSLDAFLVHTWAVTVTGAPKRWAMQFVEDNEESPRGWYAGSVGGIHFDGSMNTGLTLRTVQIKQGTASVRAGATLLWDSDPDSEEKETVLKASAFLDALREEVSPDLYSASAPPMAGVGQDKTVLVIDHDDSFVHTVANYVRQTGANVITMRHGLTSEEIQSINPNMVLLSPGPGCPSDFNVSGTIAMLLKLKIPIFGVCLGLQALVEHYGGQLSTLDSPLHGKPTPISILSHNVIFQDLPQEMIVARYHSLYAPETQLPSQFRLAAVAENGIVMAIEHKSLPIAAVQFHPESILTNPAMGLKLIRNVVSSLCEKKSAREFASQGTMI